eukprot:7393021-Pyramimonas_sp.AAC.1
MASVASTPAAPGGPRQTPTPSRPRPPRSGLSPFAPPSASNHHISTINEPRRCRAVVYRRPWMTERHQRAR